jgi:hypothetical protein
MVGSATLTFTNVKLKDCDSLPVVGLTPPAPNRPREYAASHAFATIEQNQGRKVKADSKPMEIDDPKVEMDNCGEISMPSARDIWKRRRYLWDDMNHNWTPEELEVWKDRLCCANTEQVKQTFCATTQLVPSVQHQNETFPKTSHVATFPMLVCRRLHEDIHYDKVELTRTSRFVEYGIVFYGKKLHVLALYHVGKTVTSRKCLAAMWEFYAGLWSSYLHKAQL